MKTKHSRILFILFACTLFFSSQEMFACDSTSMSKHENGKKKLIAKFEKGEKCGLWRYYAPTGLLERRERYRKGQLVFTWIYNEEGRLSKSINKKGKVKKHKSCGCH